MWHCLRNLCGNLKDKLQKLQNKAARVMMILKLWRWCWSIVRNFGVEKSRPPADQTKSHHGIKMPTWVSSELFIIEIPWTQYNLQPENNVLKLWISKAKVLALSVISKWFENFQTHSVFLLLCGRIAWIAYILPNIYSSIASYCVVCSSLNVTSCIMLG